MHILTKLRACAWEMAKGRMPGLRCCGSPSRQVLALMPWHFKAYTTNPGAVPVLILTAYFEQLMPSSFCICDSLKLQSLTCFKGLIRLFATVRIFSPLEMAMFSIFKRKLFWDSDFYINMYIFCNVTQKVF